MSFWKLIRFVSLTSVLLFGVGVFIGYRAQSQSRTGNGDHYQSRGGLRVTPFTAQAKDVSDSNDGLLPHEVLETLARRSDGSYVRSYTTESPAVEPGTVIEIFDTVSGLSQNKSRLQDFSRPSIIRRMSMRRCAVRVNTGEPVRTFGTCKARTPLTIFWNQEQGSRLSDPCHRRTRKHSSNPGRRSAARFSS